MKTQQKEEGWPALALCRALGVSRSGYGSWLRRKPGVRREADESLAERVEQVFRRHKRRYGARRITCELKSQGHVCGLKKTRRLMRLKGLRPLQVKRFKPETTLRDPRLAPAPNLLLGQPLPERLNEVWVGDITCIALCEGWAYLALLMDLCSRKIISWNLQEHMRKELVVDCLEQAIRERGRWPGLIHHSDQGSQYGSAAYVRHLERAGMLRSMSRAGNCYDNAFMESCFGTIKTELIEGGVFENFFDARVELFEYIEIYYNQQRRHSSLGYMSPEEYETQILSNSTDR